MSSSLRSYLGTIRDLPGIRQRLEVLEKDHRLLVDQVARAHLEVITEQLGSIHRTLVDADPQMAYEIITAVRDDVRTLLAEVTEQSNRVAAALAARPAVASTPTEAQSGM